MGETWRWSPVMEPIVDDLHKRKKAMKGLGLAVGIFEREERRCKDRRAFTYTAYFPERRVRFDRRHSNLLHLVELEAEEIESLLESGDELY